MKKRVGCLILAAIMLSMAASFSGCFITSVEDYFVSDGDFIYVNMMDFEKDREDKEDCYAIVGTNPQGLKDIMVVPAYYNGREVRYTWVQENWTFAENRYSINVKNAEEVHFPYAHRLYRRSPGMSFLYKFSVGERPKICFFVNTDCSKEIGLRFYGRYNSVSGYRGGAKGNYVTSFLYDYYKNVALEDEQPVREVNGYKFYIEGYEPFMQIANTAYMFNYGGQPNNGYFYIDEFERGGLIETTPYEPQRPGYVFAGWYKEPACENAWDFTKDTLPSAEYDEEGELLFVETRLYAKWLRQEG